ncbi:MAG: TMEM175 family protein [Rhodanobacter sp.]
MFIGRAGIRCPTQRGHALGKGRLEAFSDGVIAIIITIMVLELKVPTGHALEDLLPLAPVMLSYVLSFFYVGIYWNHHHMLFTSHRVSGAVLWANLHLLFWLLLFPFTTAWMGESYFAVPPSVARGVVLLMAAIAYAILQQTLIAAEGTGSALRRAVGRDRKGKLSPVIYLCGIALAFWRPWSAPLVYALSALLWLVPDRRIEGALGGRAGESG